MSEPSTYGGWLGGSSDTRKGLVVRGNLNHFRDVAGNHSTRLETGCTWNQSSSMRHSLELALAHRVDDTQHIGNHESEGGGIGGVSYLFAKIRQKTVDLTLRSAILFSRSQSLEFYLQPFLTVGDFEAIRELRRPDSYDLAPYDRPGFAARDHDFSYGSARVNAVYRWEYRPGSTFYLVWTQNRSSYAERRLAGPSSDFENGIGIAPVFDVEPENILLAKVSYWFAL